MSETPTLDDLIADARQRTLNCIAALKRQRREMHRFRESGNENRARYHRWHAGIALEEARKCRNYLRGLIAVKGDR